MMEIKLHMFYSERHVHEMHIQDVAHTTVLSYIIRIMMPINRSLNHKLHYIISITLTYIFSLKVLKLYKNSYILIL